MTTDPPWSHPAASKITTSTAKALTVDGDMTVESMSFESAPGNACIPASGFDDIPGAQVVVSDDSGKTLALANLDTSGLASGAGRCVFLFHIVNVPKIDGAYTLAVGRRGTVKYTYQDLQSMPHEVVN